MPKDKEKSPNANKKSYDYPSADDKKGGRTLPKADPRKIPTSIKKAQKGEAT